MPRATRSISLPIVLASVSVTLGIALTIGWTLVFIQNFREDTIPFQNNWLIGAGIFSLLTIVSVLVTFSIFLVREILEVRRQNSFIDSVTHELKSPLASLKLCLETLARHELDDIQREELRQMMLEDVDRLNAFIDDVLEASRLEHGQVSHLLSEVRLQPLLISCVENVRQRHKIDDEAFLIDTEPSLTIYTDRTALEIILKNLLDNAVKYSDVPIKVRVHTHTLPKDRIEILVQDQGIGIPKQHLGRIFERFYRAPQEGVRKRRGTGLGLFVVAALVKRLGGTLDAISEGESKGTCVRITLPRTPKGQESVVERLRAHAMENHSGQ
jgi:signal transduction histidine kinase